MRRGSLAVTFIVNTSVAKCHADTFDRNPYVASVSSFLRTHKDLALHPRNIISVI
jgi:hypothetical protein